MRFNFYLHLSNHKLKLLKKEKKKKNYKTLEDINIIHCMKSNKMSHILPKNEKKKEKKKTHMSEQSNE